MGVLDQFLNVMRLNPDDEEFFNDDYEFEEEPEPERPKKPAKVKKEREREKEIDYEEDDYKEKQPKSSSKITPIRSNKKQTMVGNMEVCIIKPTSMEDAREITETLRSNRAVILNLEGLDSETAQRIFDFTAGTTVAIDGNFQKVSNYIIVVTPPSIEISGDFLNLVDSFDTSGL